MSKFGGNRGGRSGGFNRGGSEKSSNYGGGSRGNSGGGRSGGGYSRGSRGGSRGNSDAVKVGDISISDKMANDIGLEAVDELRSSKIGLYVKVFPPKGVDEITLRRGDFLNIMLCESKHGGERTVGFITVTEGDNK